MQSYVKIVVERTGKLHRLVLNWGKTNFDGIQELTKVDWSRFLAGKAMSEKWDAFKSVMTIY